MLKECLLAVGVLKILGPWMMKIKDYDMGVDVDVVEITSFSEQYAFLKI